MQSVGESIVEKVRDVRGRITEQCQRTKKFVRDTRIVVQSPVTLCFVGLMVIVFIATLGGNAFVQTYAAPPASHGMLRLSFWARLLIYPLAHGSTGHLTGNLSLILLLAPLVEARLGSRAFLALLVFTSITGGLANAILSSHGIIGASGIVFMLITLTPLANNFAGPGSNTIRTTTTTTTTTSSSSSSSASTSTGSSSGFDPDFSSNGGVVGGGQTRRESSGAHQLPATFVLLFIFYVGKELSLMFSNDGVSHLGHLVGGLLGATVGLLLRSQEQGRVHIQSGGLLDNFLGLFKVKDDGASQKKR